MRRLAGLTLTCALWLGVASCKQIEEGSYCRRICEELRVCIDDDLSVSSCSDKCVDALDDNHSLRKAAERCSDCIDDNACRDIPSECSSCDEVLSDFTDRRFSELVAGAPAEPSGRAREGVSVSDKPSRTTPESPGNTETTEPNPSADSDAGK